MLFWTSTLVLPTTIILPQFNPGLQGFLSLLNLQDEQEALIKRLCFKFECLCQL